MSTAFPFTPESYETELRAILVAVADAPELDREALAEIVRRHPKDGRGFFSKSELIRGARFLERKYGWPRLDGTLLEKLRMKPVRTLSGVAPVTVLTKPYPCPGRCIFCPSDVRMPKSYLSDEPGAQRASEHQFDPYRQTLSRLLTLHNTGHRVDKVELIILGGTWSFYPEPYQVWFVKRCFDALHDFGDGVGELVPLRDDLVDFRTQRERVDGRLVGSAEREQPSYNRVVRAWLDRHPEAEREEAEARAGWAELEAVMRRNESAAVRCVGLVVETRPDHLPEEEVLRIRRLGATKVQIGIQSLDDRVLELNRRGHTTAETRRAMALLRAAGFKIHAHWMPNLYGSSPAQDTADFERLFGDPDYRPDELKVYPCSLIESAELMRFYERGDWRPYDHDELLSVLTACLERAPEYCRLTRVIRDIPGTDIVAGNRVTNFRQVAEDELGRCGGSCRDIRSREVRGLEIAPDELELRELEYEASRGREIFLQMTTAEDRLAAFLRLRLPSAGEPPLVDELAASALVREVHVYGSVVGLGERDGGRAQHSGLGSRLVARAAEIAAAAGYRNLAVISAVGTRGYYRQLGFDDGRLYQHLDLR